MWKLPEEWFLDIVGIILRRRELGKSFIKILPPIKCLNCVKKSASKKGLSLPHSWCIEQLLINYSIYILNLLKSIHVIHIIQWKYGLMPPMTMKKEHSKSSGNLIKTCCNYLENFKTASKNADNETKVIMIDLEKTSP